jgi:TDG/mug DNA glycosylase family protein
MARKMPKDMAKIMAKTLMRPTRDQLVAAANKKVPDIVAPGLRVLFCGINPGLYSAAVGHHFARPGNRFWPALHRAGFTDRLLSPFEEKALLQGGYGITNVVNRSTATASELPPEELLAGAERLTLKVKRYQPEFIAMLGVGAYRTAFSRPKAVLGRQNEMIGPAFVWVLPNPSGLNAHYQIKELTALFKELFLACQGSDPRH